MTCIKSCPHTLGKSAAKSAAKPHGRFIFGIDEQGLQREILYVLSECHCLAQSALRKFAPINAQSVLLLRRKSITKRFAKSCEYPLKQLKIVFIE
ncbi:hypothetical protein AXE65_05845 [Ventosimonas gracilis]|uniref:Uncharacterized protein n=1 Tax=Ventosimonas gracilis TaxID=1680762 RepID=A0A139SMG0_9GAMM|nr:hypothetical protein AXE65_05845 [Ventosimonas gracilis]